MAAQDKPRILITGGVGFIGRCLVQHLVEGDLASSIRVVDKVPPITGWLSERQKELFQQVDFKQANLANPSSCERVFTDEQGAFDFVFHLAGETKYGQTDEVYRELIYTVTVNCAEQAARTGVKRFIDVSTAQVYNCDKGSSNERSKLDPWTLIAKHKLAAESVIAAIPGLNYIILRPGIVYGPGDKTGITPRLIIAAVYHKLQEKMMLLWTKDLRMNTVHVRDVCHALWHLKDHGESKEVYNLVDKSDTTQGIISELVSQIFEISHGYHGQVLSNLARLHMNEAVEESNEKHLAPWSQACSADGIHNTPLTPYIDKELLYNRHLQIDGKKIESTGYHYRVPKISIELLKEVVDEYVKCGLFPRSLVPW